MIDTALPTSLIGPMLEEQLASAGVPSKVSVLEGRLLLVDLGESQRAAAEQVIANHVPLAAAELTRLATERSNEATIQDRAASALATNTAFLAIASPSNLQILNQLKAITRQNQGLIRLGLHKFDGTD